MKKSARYVRFFANRLEEAFFRPMETEFAAEFRKKMSLPEKLQAFSEMTGIRDRRQLMNLVGLGFRPSTLTAFTWIPLAFVAWADGNFDDQEKRAMLDALVNRGVSRKSAILLTSHEWFLKRPDGRLWDLWRKFAHALLSRQPVSARNELMDEIVTRCHVVANASGCGNGNDCISGKEWEVIDQVTEALGGFAAPVAAL